METARACASTPPKLYAHGRWRKRKGLAEVRLRGGEIARAEIHRYEATGLGKCEFKIKRLLWGSGMAKISKRFAICVNNTGYEVSLERRMIYVVVPDARAERLDEIRVIDESGEDYLYPADSFVSLTFPRPIRKAVLQAA